MNTNKAGGLTRQAGQVRQSGSQADSIDLATLIANIFAAATNRTKIHNKTGSLFNEMSMTQSIQSQEEE
jgi:hypothetical protein